MSAGMTVLTRTVPAMTRWPDVAAWEQWRYELPLPRELPPWKPLWHADVRPMLLEMQGGVCGLCLRRPHPVLDNGHPSIDHDHRTGLIRAVVCDYCNLAEGRTVFQTHPLFVAYRRYPPAYDADLYERSYADFRRGLPVRRGVLPCIRREPAGETDPACAVIKPEPPLSVRQLELARVEVSVMDEIGRDLRQAAAELTGDVELSDARRRQLRRTVDIDGYICETPGEFERIALERYQVFRALGGCF